MSPHHIGLELRSLNNLIHRRLDANAARLSLESITGTNGWIIGYIAQNKDRDIYQKDLEEEFTITRSTTSKVLNLMEQKGLIRRQSVPHDARLRKIVLTPMAEELVDRMSESKEEMEGILLKGFRPEEIDQLYGYLQRMKDNVQS